MAAGPRKCSVIRHLIYKDHEFRRLPHRQTLKQPGMGLKTPFRFVRITCQNELISAYLNGRAGRRSTQDRLRTRRPRTLRSESSMDFGLSPVVMEYGNELIVESLMSSRFKAEDHLDRITSTVARPSFSMWKI